MVSEGMDAPGFHSSEADYTECTTRMFYSSAPSKGTREINLETERNILGRHSLVKELRTCGVIRMFLRGSYENWVVIKHYRLT